MTRIDDAPLWQQAAGAAAGVVVVAAIAVVAVGWLATAWSYEIGSSVIHSLRNRGV